MEELKNIVRQIRDGQQVEGYALEGDILKGPDGWYKVQGESRLRLTECPVEKEGHTDIPETKEDLPTAKPPRPKEKKEYLTERVCSCGKTFALTKFNQKLDKCPDCRKHVRRTGSVEREFICPDCGVTYHISKFQPYLTPERCPKCSRRKNKKDKKA